VATRNRNVRERTRKDSGYGGELGSPGRRAFMVFAGASAGATLLGTLPGCGGSVNAAPGALDPIWGTVGLATQIINSLQGITQSMFPSVDFTVTSYGAQQCSVVAATNPYTGTTSPTSPGANLTNAAGAFDSRPAFLAAIQACNAAGGGRVVVPSGNWYCAGPIVLLSNVNFHLSSNCTIYFSPNPADYAKDGPVNCGANGNLFYSRWQANDCLNFGAPVYARNQTKIAITGEDTTSILNGQAMTPFAGSGNTATCWWTYKGSKGEYGCAGSTTPSQAYTNPNNVDLKTVAPNISDALYALLTSPTTPWQQDQNYLPALSEAGVPVAKRIFGLGHYLRPCMVEFIGCTNVLMEDYHTQNTPFWQHHPTDCTNLVIRGVFADSIGPNNDGFDPDACSNVLCDTVTFNTGDDCIAIKSGKALDTEYGPSQNIVVQNCTMNSGHGGITLGSEMSGGVQNVYARNLQMLNQNWATNPLNIAIRIKTNMNRGGFVRNFYVDGVTLPNGVTLTGGGYGSSLLAGSPINSTVPLGVAASTAGNPSASQGGLITFDCDYDRGWRRSARKSAGRAEREHFERAGDGRDTWQQDGLVLSGHCRAGAGWLRLQRTRADADDSADHRCHDLELQPRHAGQQRHRNRHHAGADLRVQRQRHYAEKCHHWQHDLQHDHRRPALVR
jgi:polygalacturonase